jgi:hypothetical protein
METYIKYGKEWEKEVLRNPKKVIVGMLRRVAMERDELYRHTTSKARKSTVKKNYGNILN